MSTTEAGNTAASESPENAAPAPATDTTTEDGRSGLRGWVGRNRSLAIGGGIAIIVVIGLGLFAAFFWFGFQNAFIDSEVQDDVIEVAEPADADTDTGAPERTDEDGAPLPAEPPPPAEPTLVSESEFIDLDHAGTGRAQLIENPDGTYVIQFLDLDVLNGPDLRVILSPAAVTPDAGAYDEGLVDIGALRGNVGNQVYEVPPDVDVSQFNSVAIWCRRFNSTFNAAGIGT